MSILQNHNSRRGDAAGFVVFALAGCMVVTWLLGTLLYMVIPQSAKVTSTSSTQSSFSSTSLNSGSSGDMQVAMKPADGGSTLKKENGDTPNSETGSGSGFSSSLNLDAPDPDEEEAAPSSVAKSTDDSKETDNSFFKPSNPPERNEGDNDFSATPGSGTNEPSFLSPAKLGGAGNTEELKPEFAAAPENSTDDATPNEPDPAEPIFGKITEPTEPEMAEPQPAEPEMAEVTEPKATDITEPAPSENLETPTPTEPIVYPMREFVSQNGGTATMAFVRWSDIPGNVIMKKDDGKLFRVPVDRFSESDQEYLNSIPKLTEQ